MPSPDITNTVLVSENFNTEPLSKFQVNRSQSNLRPTKPSERDETSGHASKMGQHTIVEEALEQILDDLGGGDA